MGNEQVGGGKSDRKELLQERFGEGRREKYSAAEEWGGYKWVTGRRFEGKGRSEPLMS